MKYLLIRLALFVVALAICLWVGTGLVLGAIFAALISFALGYLFFTRQRDDAAVQLAGTFAGKAKPGRAEEDAAAEDAALDGTQASENGKA
ncbi:DUF4229 domain-containing protein [Arthrobacter sp. NPDC090010]|uniref:DUF4229 domain-containing protein n=1 Tax=Arthrobacter sp. NPDC090010 TaxID=3363942 RepID=UPI003824F49E